MDFETLQIIAGFASTAVFVSSKFPMLLKALRTRDLHSYSLGHIALSISGNLIYWLYVVSLPLGPIWVLQAFFTMADLLLFSCYLRYELLGRGQSRGDRAHPVRTETLSPDRRVAINPQTLKGG